jgi:hypothetical protein
VVHADGPQHRLLDVGLERHASRRGDDLPERQVSDVGVSRRLSHRVAVGVATLHHLAEQSLRLGSFRSGKVRPADRQRVAEAGGVGEQLPHGGLPKTGRFQVVHVLPNRGVQIEATLVGEPKGGGGGHDLGHREPQIRRGRRR